MEDHGGDLNHKCDENCAHTRLFNLIGKKSTLPIIGIIIHASPIRFNSILKEIGGSPKTLTDRLKELEAEGIITRKAYAEIPPRVEYSMTEKGEDLKHVLFQMNRWADKWGG